MTLNVQDGGAVDVGSGAEDMTTNPETQSGETKTVKWEDHDRALKDMHRYKEKAKQVDEFKKEIDRLKQEKLKEAQDYKTLYESTEQRLIDEQTKNQRMVESVYNTEKYRAIEMAAMKAGIRKESLELLTNLPLDGVAVETTSEGRFLVHGAETFVENYKRKMPFLFQTNQAPNINSGGAGGFKDDGGVVTAQMVVTAEREKHRSPEKNKHYLSLLSRFQEQRKK